MHRNELDEHVQARGYENNRQEQHQHHQQYLQQFHQQFNMTQTSQVENMESYHAGESLSSIADEHFQQDESSQCTYKLNEFKFNHYAASDSQSYIEKLILNSNEPLKSNETEKIIVNGQTGIWMNKEESLNWDKSATNNVLTEDIELCEDEKTKVMTDVDQAKSERVLTIRYIRPAIPPSKADVPIKIEFDCSAQPVILPVTRICHPTPPPQKEFVKTPIDKPISILLERNWPKKEQEPVDLSSSYKFVQVYDEVAQIYRNYVYLGVVDTDPEEYYRNYGPKLNQNREINDYLQELYYRPEFLMFSEDYDEEYYSRQPPELEGDVEALNLIDLDKAGLSEYKYLLEKLNVQQGAAVQVAKLVSNQQQHEEIFEHRLSESSASYFACGVDETITSK